MKRIAARCAVAACVLVTALIGAGIASADAITIQSGNGPMWGTDANVQVVAVDNTGLAANCSADNSVGPAAVVSHPAYTVIPGTNYSGFNNTSCRGYVTMGGPANTFETSFTLPAGATGVSLSLQIRADNGFQASLNGGAPFTGTGYAYPNDPCGGTFYGTAYPTAPTFTVTSGFVSGLNKIDFTVDNCGGVSSTGVDFLGTVTFTVGDTVAPVISGMPADLTREATGPAGAAVSWPDPTATDNVDGTVPVACTPASGSTFAIGTTTVTCTATDAAGNSASASFSVTVVDTTPPTVTASLVRTKKGGDDESAQQFRVVFSAADLVGVTSLVGKLNGVSVTNGQVVTLKTLKKGAQKVKRDDGKLQIAATSFLLTVTATDAAGNVGSATVVPVFTKNGKDDEDKKGDR